VLGKIYEVDGESFLKRMIRHDATGADLMSVGKAKV
jgi:hypothetical protein